MYMLQNVPEKAEASSLSYKSSQAYCPLSRSSAVMFHYNMYIFPDKMLTATQQFAKLWSLMITRTFEAPIDQ